MREECTFNTACGDSTFQVPFEDTLLQGDALPFRKRCQALYLHGAGNSSRKANASTRSMLQNNGVGTISFDYLGHGETGGPVEASSLARRGRQVDMVLSILRPDRPVGVIGSSMGGYDAIMCTSRHHVDGLVLVVPAVYAASANEVLFGPAFSALIRRPRSWMATDAWAVLEAYRGRLLVLAAEHDDVIPLEIPERIVGAAVNAESRELLVVPGTTHGAMFARIRQSASLTDKVMASVHHALQSS